MPCFCQFLHGGELTCGKYRIHILVGNDHYNAKEYGGKSDDYPEYIPDIIRHPGIYHIEIYHPAFIHKDNESHKRHPHEHKAV